MITKNLFPINSNRDGAPYHAERRHYKCCVSSCVPPKASSKVNPASSCFLSKLP